MLTNVKSGCVDSVEGEISEDLTFLNLKNHKSNECE
jgi:hypothetical protein